MVATNPDKMTNNPAQHVKHVWSDVVFFLADLPFANAVRSGSRWGEPLQSDVALSPCLPSFFFSLLSFSPSLSLRKVVREGVTLLSFLSHPLPF